jgi:MoxR-like ATPase
MSEVEDVASVLTSWRARATRAENEVKKAVVGQDHAIRMIITALFSRGHTLLEGDVGVGKTTVLRAITRALGGAYERVEGTVDLMPNDLLYYTYVNEEGRPKVEPGPMLRHGEGLATFFFNEINRARPQVHALLLRAMAERTVNAFNREYRFPHLQVFADRNRVEREETFEIPSAARDRFMFELSIEAPTNPTQRASLAFNPMFHDTETLIEKVEEGVLPYDELNRIGHLIQETVTASPAIREYVLNLWEATHHPEAFGINLSGVDISNLVLAGASPRGIAMLMKAARVSAWIAGRDYMVPEDIHVVFDEVMAHRIFFTPVYEMRRGKLGRELTKAILAQVAAP